MELAYSLPMSGHIGANKTQDRILQHFNWPKLTRSVALFVKTCHVCQMVVKPNWNVKPATFKSLSAFYEPFSRVIIDCVKLVPCQRQIREQLSVDNHVCPYKVPRSHAFQKNIIPGHYQGFGQILYTIIWHAQINLI